jgi:ketosteroid isomerase-like protein
MYRFVVERLLRASFDNLNRGDYDAVLRHCVEDVEHVFPGNTALGGTQHRRESVRQWFARLFTIFPRFEFIVRNVAVRGWPWHSVAVVEWTNTATPLDGLPYENAGILVVELRWGKVTSIREYLDTDKVTEVCRRLAARGVPEASAPRIVD